MIPRSYRQGVKAWGEVGSYSEQVLDPAGVRAMKKGTALLPATGIARGADRSAALVRGRSK